MAKTSISFIVPALNEQDNIIPLYDEFDRTFAGSGLAWDLVFIDDGSTDDTLPRQKSLSETKSNVTVVSFSRNFGKEAAIWAGLQNAKGDIVGIIDADLQQTPQDALAMTQILLENEDVDMVAAFQEKRHENPFTAFCKEKFYKVMAFISDMPLIKDASDFRVFRRNVANAILQIGETQRFSKGIFSWIGFKCVPYAYEPSTRNSGETKWSFKKLLKYSLDGIMSFSTKPLKVASYIGFAISLLSLIYLICVVVQKLAFGIDIPGYPTLVTLILLLGGIQLFFLGIAGEYIGRTYIQSKNRPIYIEARHYPPKSN